MLSTSVLYLSDVPEFIALVPGTKMRDVAPSTQKKYKDCIARFIEFMGEDVPVETIDRETYAAFHEWLGTRGTRAITCNGYRRRQRAIWNRLRERGIDVCDNRVSAFSDESLGELPPMVFHFIRSFLLSNGRISRYSAFSKAVLDVET